MLTTTGGLLVGGTAALMIALIETSGAAAEQAPALLLFLGATVALGLVRERVSCSRGTLGRYATHMHRPTPALRTTLALGQRKAAGPASERHSPPPTWGG